MKINLALLSFIIFGILYFIATFLPNETLIYISKPAMVISLIVYYWVESKQNISIKFNVILYLYLISAILNIFQDSYVFMYVMLSKLIIHVLLLFTVVKILNKLKYRIFDQINITYLALTTLFLASLVYFSLFVIFDYNYELYVLIVLYCIFLPALCICCTAYYALRQNQSSLYLLLASFSFIITDLFYVIYYYYLDIIFFRILSVFCNIITVYFLVKFFILYDSNEDAKNLIDNKNDL